MQTNCNRASSETKSKFSVSFNDNSVLRVSVRTEQRAAAEVPTEQPNENEPAALRDYARRIEAERKHFRRYVVREQSESGYHRDKFVISIALDGEITVRAPGRGAAVPNEVKPTAEEQEKIKAQIAVANWPKSIDATKTKVEALRNELRGQYGGRTPKLFEFLDPTGTKVMFVQERMEDKAGKKNDLPWSFFSDGKWRRMEPDHIDGLPLFGLDQLKDAARVFLHEGPKAALHVQCMTGARHGWEAEQMLIAHPHLKDCPWKGELSGAAHLGWPGGAPNPLRVDWGPIAKLPEGVQVIVVCDNDRVGEEAVSTISARLKRRMSALRFDDRFPPGFDLADGWPRHKSWSRGPRYVGPSLDQMLEPATWATDVVPLPVGAGRPIIRLRKEFAAEWWRCKKPSVFIHREYCDRLLDAEAFNAVVRPFSDAEDTAKLLARSFSSQAGGIAYFPRDKKLARRRAEITNVEGERLVNTFRGSNIVPVKGNPMPWLRFITHLIPDKSDRRELLRWCATLIAKPDVKMLYAVLLISEAQGVGKGTLGDGVLAPLVGLWNVSFPSEHALVDASFNAWAAHKRLVVAHEIYSGHSRKAYDRLKSVITDRRIDVSRKYMEEYTLENYVHILACSNSLQALHVDDEDRRWFVPRVTEKKKPEAYWRDLHAWLNGGGRGIIAWWAEEFLQKNPPVERGARAPNSTAKAEIVEGSRSDGGRLARDLGQLAMEKLPEKIVISVDDVRAYVASVRKLALGDKFLEKPLTLRKALRLAGMREPVRPPRAKEERRFRVGGAEKSYVVANFVITPDMQWEDLKTFYRTPDKLLRM